MKGSYEIRVRNRTMAYHFTVYRNITILQGNSATGKTTLVDMIREHEMQGEDSAVTVNCKCPCMVVEGNTWKRQLEEIEDSIVFIDEGNRFTASREFADMIAKSSNYYVIVTRVPLYALPYSVGEIYGIRSTGKYGELTPVYHEMFRIYTSEESKTTSDDGQTLIAEDSNSGYQFFSGVCKEKISCISAGGNGNILNTVMEKYSSGSVIVIADGAAFGPFMSKLMPWLKRHPGVTLYLPESFEWLILKSGLIDGNRIQQILANPSDYVESVEFFSWEQFFTSLLIKETRGTWLQYQKAKLNEVYLHKKQVDAIAAVLPETIRKLIQ